jgi:hypothetical protein
MLDPALICSTCSAAISASDHQLATQALLALGHYVHYATGERARDATIETITVVTAAPAGGVHLCLRCICRGLALSDPEMESDPDGWNALHGRAAFPL